MHANAVISYAIADDATFLQIDHQEGMVPVAIYAAAWTPASFTLQLLVGNSGLSGETDVYKASDDTAVNLTDDTWVAIPVGMARKIAGHRKARLLFNAAESGGPITAWISWAPLEAPS